MQRLTSYTPFSPYIYPQKPNTPSQKALLSHKSEELNWRFNQSIRNWDMAATIKSLGVIILIVALSGAANVVRSQAPPPPSCSTELINLNVCAPYVVPGNGQPSADCCNALQSVNHDCLCNTIRIASSLPTACSLPALNCNLSPPLFLSPPLSVVLSICDIWLVSYYESYILVARN